METTLPFKSQKLLKASVSAVVFFICIVAAEIFLRRFAPISDPYEIYKTSRQNSYIRSQYRPKYRLRTETEQDLPGVSRVNIFTTNNVGFRGDYLAIPKPANELRVFLVGGSSTECLYLDDSQAIDRVLQNELGQRTPSGTTVKVFNAGKSGDRSDDHISMIVHRIIHTQPDVMIVFSGINDLSAAIAKADSLHLDDSVQKRFTFSELLRMAFTEFQIPRRLYYVGKKLLFKRDVREVLEEVTSRSNYREKMKFISKFPVSNKRPQADPTAYRNNLTTIAGVARGHGVRLVFMTQQTTWNSSIDAKVKDWQWMVYRAGTRYTPEALDQALESFNDVMRQVALEHGVPVYDTARVIPKSLDYFYDDVHFNLKGARQAALGLADFLVDSGVLDVRRGPLRKQTVSPENSQPVETARALLR